MSNSQNASLVLNTASGTDVSLIMNQVLTVANKSAHQWTNINLRTLLGDMYDKYDTFNLCLNTVASSLPNSVAITTQALSASVQTAGTQVTLATTNAAIQIGQYVTGVNVPPNTTVSNISSNTLTLSNPTLTGIPASTVLSFYSAGFATNENLQVIMRVSGLPFINNTYNITSSGNVNSSYCTIGTFTFGGNSTATQYFYGSNIATFGKNQDICNITIDYIRISDLKGPTVTNTLNIFPNVSFIFDIFGIDKQDKNQNGTRLTIN